VLKVHTHPSLAPITHGFFTRAGGVSTGIYAGLNVGLGSNDDPAAVIENRRRARDHLGADHLVTVYQIHSATCVVVDAPWAGDAPQADALVTTTPGLALGVLTADCAPVLFADRKAGVIGAAHAGWKGAYGGVLDATLDAMRAQGATQITAVIGPSIGQDNYEVGPEFYDRFADDREARTLFTDAQTDGKRQFDLTSYVALRLLRAGVADVHSLDICTYAHTDLFSHRRSLHQADGDYGRNLSAIAL
jgi:hypothetical protein